VAKNKIPPERREEFGKFEKPLSLCKNNPIVRIEATKIYHQNLFSFSKKLFFNIKLFKTLTIMLTFNFHPFNSNFSDVVTITKC